VLPTHHTSYPHQHCIIFLFYCLSSEKSSTFSCGYYKEVTFRFWCLCGLGSDCFLRRCCCWPCCPRGRPLPWFQCWSCRPSSRHRTNHRNVVRRQQVHQLPRNGNVRGGASLVLPPPSPPPATAPARPRHGRFPQPRHCTRRRRHPSSCRHAVSGIRQLSRKQVTWWGNSVLARPRAPSEPLHEEAAAAAGASRPK